MNSKVALASFPYVQFGQFKVCNNKCELKVGKWTRMNNSNENGNFLWVPLQKFEHFNRAHVVIRILCNTQYSSAINSFGWKKNIFSKVHECCRNSCSRRGPIPCCFPSRETSRLARLLEFGQGGKVRHIHLFQVCVNWTRPSLLAVDSWKGDRVLVNILLIPALLH